MQKDWKPRNLAERVRKQAWGYARHGSIEGYTRLVAFSLDREALRAAQG